MRKWNKTYRYGLTVSPAFNTNIEKVQLLQAQKQVQDGQVTLMALGVSSNV
jgi:hypothetical protein